jgi:hypothetical protein
MSRIDHLMYTAVLMNTRELTDVEIASANLIIQMDLDPKEMEWYPKISGLFTEDKGTRVHSDVKDILAAIVLDRLG